jgi:TatD DNase family protein
MTPKYIDIHSHVNFKAFKEDGDAVIKRALENDTWVINVGSQFSTSRRAVEIANKYSEGVYAIVGLHPIHLDEAYHDEEEVDGEGFRTRVEEFNKEAFGELLKDPKVVAIGECGLDYYHLKEDSIEKQKKTFIEQIELAKETSKPLMVHCRDGQKSGVGRAFDDLLEVLKESRLSIPFVSHSFVRDLKLAEELLKLGSYFSFNGIITFPKTDDYVEVIKFLPLDRILSETDSPYLTPVPHRGQRNEPVYVKEIVRKIAEIKNLPEEEVAKAIMANARKVFGIQNPLLSKERAG